MFKQHSKLGFSIFEKEATGSDVVFLHGLGASAQYGTFLEALYPTSRLIFPELPGHGSTAKWEKVDIYEITLKLLELFDALGIENPVLCGHSLGAQISMLCEIVRPGYASSLKLIAPAGVEDFNAMQKQIILQSLRFGNLFQGMLAPAMQDLSIPGHGKVADAETILHYMESMLERPVSDLLDRIKCKVDVYVGSQDILIPNRLFTTDLPITYFTNKLSGLDNYKVVPMHGVGHWPMVENPVALVSYMQ